MTYNLERMEYLCMRPYIRKQLCHDHKTHDPANATSVLCHLCAWNVLFRPITVMWALEFLFAEVAVLQPAI